MAPLKFSESFVSWVIDGLRRYIANTDEVEHAGAGFATLNAQHLSAGTVTKVDIYTTDIATSKAGRNRALE